MKSKKMAYLLWLIGAFGCLGFHRFYLRKTRSGLLWLFTGGLVGVGSLIDLFSLGEQVKQANSLQILEKLARGEEITEFKQFLGDNSRSPEVTQNGYCPYCLGILTCKAKHNIKCPFCQQEIYVRLEPVICENNLLTAEDAVVVDYFPKFGKFGITAADFIQKRAEMQEKFGKEVTLIDVIWNLVNQVILSTKDIVILKGIYHCLALFLQDLHKDCYYVLHRAIKMQLLEFQRDGFTKQVRIVNLGPGTCPACRKLEGKIYSLDEALKLMPLPCKECSHKLTKRVSGFCQCSFQANS